MTSTISSRDFNNDAARAKRATAEGPVVITDRGRPAHVLMSWPDYARLTGQGGGIVELLDGGAAAEAAFDPAPLPGPARAADLG